MKAITRNIRWLVQDDMGNIAMMFGLMIFVIFGGAGVAIDFQRSNMMRAEINEATDAGVLAAARYRSSHPGADDDELTAVARRVFDNGISNASPVKISSFRVAFNDKTDTFVAEVDGKMDSLIMGMLGNKYVDLGTQAEVRLGVSALVEVAMALDVTGSMSKNGRMTALKKAANDLVDTLFVSKDADVKIGIVPFAQYVNVGTKNSGKSWLKDPGKGWVGCVGSRNYPKDVEDGDYLTDKAEGVITTSKECPKQLIPLTDNEASLTSAINGFSPDGLTYIPAGLLWGWNLLTPEAPFTEGVSFSDLKANNGTKALVLMTDGFNTRSPSYPLHAGYDTNLANDLTKEICENIKKDEIVVYTIAFELTDATIKKILEGCATSGAHYFDAENSDQLSDAFEAIASSLRNISLSK